MNHRRKVLIVFDTITTFSPEEDFTKYFDHPDWATERDVTAALTALGHEWQMVSVFDDLAPLEEQIKKFQPDVIFNLAEGFKGRSEYDRDIASYLELTGIPYTGCGPTGLTLSKDKGISKQILSFHRIDIPDFVILRRGKKPRRPKRLKFPLIVKPLTEEASYGIAQASYVESDEDLTARAQFIHENRGQDAIAEEYVEGREIYASIIGNGRLQMFPLRELRFHEVPEGEPRMATYKAKWDESYRKRWGIRNQFAGPLPDGVPRRIEKMARKVYRLLGLRGYARLDLRLTPENRIVFIEANPNPILAREEDFAESALKAGIPYPELIQRILSLAVRNPNRLTLR